MNVRRQKSERALSYVTFALPLIAYVAVYFLDGTGFRPSGDGYYSWIFARSLAFDADLDLRNDYALCGDPFHVGLDRGTGHPDNPFYIGPAVFLVVPLTLLRGLFTLFIGADRASISSCGGWLTALTILAGPICGALSVWFAYRASRLVASRGPAAFSSLLFAFMSPLFPHSTSVAHYSHVYLTFIVSTLTYLSLRIITIGYRRRDGIWFSLAIATAILHRAPAALYALLAAPALVSAARGQRASDWARIALGATIGVVIGVGLTGGLYLYLYGNWVALPQGPYYVHLNHAHPWLLLFGVHGGFFFWMPGAWLSVPGLLLAFRRPRIKWFGVACAMASAVEVMISSAPLDWHGNWSLGARRLLPLTPFVIVFSSIAIERIHAAIRPSLKSGRWVTAACVMIVCMVLVNNIPASTIIRGDKELSQRELYGSLSPLRPLWSVLDRAGIDVALVPAEIYFSLRYGLPTRSYRAAIKPHYVRSYRDLTFSDAELDLRSREFAELISGPHSPERGLEVTTRENRLVFTSEWPFATHMRLLVSGVEGAKLEIGRRRALGSTTRIGAVTLSRGNQEGPAWVELELPEGSFDSGMNEYTFSTDVGQCTISIIAIEDRTPRTPHGELTLQGPRNVTAELRPALGRPSAHASVRGAPRRRWSAPIVSIILKNNPIDERPRGARLGDQRPGPGWQTPS